MNIPVNHALQPIDTAPRFLPGGTAVVTVQLFLPGDLCQCDTLIRGSEEIRTRRYQHVMKPIGQTLALLKAQTNTRIKRPETLVEIRQQGFVIATAQFDDLLIGVEIFLPRLQPFAQIFQILIVAQRRLKIIRCH